MQKINEKLKDAGLTVTTSQATILSIIKQLYNKPINVPELYILLIQKHKKIAISTVYRRLRQLEGIGIVNRFYSDGEKSVYVLNDDYYNHLHCSKRKPEGG